MVIAAWNARDVLERCLDSLDRQDLAERIEVIVVDDGSTDATPELLAGRPLVRRAHNPESRGYCASINQGAALAGAPLLLLCNSDVEFIRPDSVRRLLEHLREPGVGVVAPRYLRPDGTDQPGIARFPSVSGAIILALGLHHLMPDRLKTRLAPAHSAHSETADVDWVMGAVVGIDTALFAELGGYWPLMYSSETDLAWRVAQKGLRTRFVRESQVVHVGNFSNSQRWSDPGRAARVARSELIFLETHYGRARAMLIRMANWAGAVIRIPILRVLGRSRRAEEYAAMARVYRRGPGAPLSQ